jgi:hypothetical protein
MQDATTISHEIHALFCAIGEMSTGMDNTSVSIRTLTTIGIQRIENLIDLQSTQKNETRPQMVVRSLVQAS